MLFGGVVLLIWVFVRRRVRARTSQRRDQQVAARQQQQWIQEQSIAVPLADAPREVLRWQSSMYDLQRELTAELETRIAVVQSLVRTADQRIAELREMQRRVERMNDGALEAIPGDVPLNRKAEDLPPYPDFRSGI